MNSRGPCCLALITGIALLASTTPAGARDAPSYRQDITGFVSAKGERALVMGYGALEVWAYPLQLMSDYRLRFRVAGSVEPLDAAPLLRRIERTPTETVRTYVGANFVVRERLFVPRRQAGVILDYEVAGKPDVRIEASFRPSLDLMWPGALGGRSTQWDVARSGYVMREPLHGFAATIASREAVDHDDPVNYARAPAERLALVLAPRADPDDRRRATLAIALDPDAGTNAAAALRDGAAAARIEAVAHADGVLAQALAIETPDAALNKALASATLALDQSWSCNDRLGCGVVAGYGPSRPDRRPQYAWFFAGDGLVAMEGMLATGQFERARNELDFVTRYQDPKTGMIWHEMSQSAALIDWVKNYHYMYVHVDITFQYLAAVQRYVATTGDKAFVRANWRALSAAWRYCVSVIDPTTGLPGIPPGKQGQNEQEDLRDDIRLSSLWIDAADGFAELAATRGDAALAKRARVAAEKARAAIARDGWDDANGFWLSGHRRDGMPVTSQRPDAIGVLGQGIVSPARVARVLDRIATPDFVTDWGIRSLAASDRDYDPNLYSAGSVWALGSATVAEAFWQQHRPLVGWAAWRGLAAGDTLDSAGHLHELMAGDLYHPEYESVPEQTWSSAGLLLAGVRGMLGLDVRGGERRIGFAPHLPPGWDHVTVRNVRVGDDRLTLALRRDPGGIALEIDNPGAPVTVDFAPMVPLGAVPTSATIDGRSAPVAGDTHGQDSHARLRIEAPHGTTRVRIGYAGGVDLAPVAALPALGQRSRNPIVAVTTLSDDVLRVAAWVSPEGSADLLLATDRAPHAVTGGSIRREADGRYRLTLTGPAATGYALRSATVALAQ